MAPIRPHLSSWHGGEARCSVGEERVLHRVHSETVEGGLGAHILLEAFDHSTIESGPNRGHWPGGHPTLCATPTPRPRHTCPQLHGSLPVPTAAPAPTPPDLRETVPWAHLSWGFLPLRPCGMSVCTGLCPCLSARNNCRATWGCCPAHTMEDAPTGDSSSPLLPAPLPSSFLPLLLPPPPCPCSAYLNT